MIDSLNTFKNYFGKKSHPPERPHPIFNNSDYLYLIGKHLGPKEITTLSLANKDLNLLTSSKDFGIENELWFPVAKKLNLNISSKSTAKEAVKNYVLDLKRRIREFPIYQVPKDIRDIIDEKIPPSFEKIQLLIEFCKARDTLVIGDKIKRTPPETYESSSTLIEKANEFPYWMLANQALLAQTTSLNLSFLSLSSIPKSLVHLTNLRLLSLSGNEFSSIPESLGQFTNLQLLDLSNNKLSSIPESLGRLTNLIALNLSFNKLTSLPKSLDQLINLNELHLAGNELTSLPDSFVQLRNLIYLDFSFNKLTSNPPFLAQLPNLRFYNRHNPVTSIIYRIRLLFANWITDHSY